MAAADYPRPLGARPPTSVLARCLHELARLYRDNAHQDLKAARAARLAGNTDAARHAVRQALAFRRCANKWAARARAGAL